MTIKEIAEKAGVSIGTVDRVLHNRGRVSEVTREKVLAIVAESGYQTNLFASNLANSRKRFEFAILMPKLMQDSGYWSLVKQGIDQACVELKGFNVTVTFFHFDRFSEASFEKSYHEMMMHSFDGIFMAPVISQIAEKCLNTNKITVPYIFFDSKLKGFDNISYVGQNSYQGGRLGGKLMHLLLRQKGSIAVTKMLPVGNHIIERARGFKSYFDDLDGYTIQEFEVASQDHEQAIERVCLDIEETCPDLLGVFVTNANTHYFAKYFKKKQGEKIKVVGFDLVDENRHCIEQGGIEFVISQNPELQGYKGLTVLYRSVVLKENCDSEYMVPLDIVTRENLSRSNC